MDKVAIVILNWNGAKMLAQYLPTVLNYSRDEAVVYVADNASTDTSVSLLQRQFPECRLIQLDRNWGFAEGYNKALGQIQSTRVATKIPEQRSYSLLWHYYVKGRKYFSQLP